ncbi:MAG: hypothetical protein ABSG29_08735 [Steroidobacteraceae bacterium]
MEARKLSKPQPLPFELSFRIRHPSMDPAELSRELGLTATHSFRAGEPRRPGSDSMSLHGESYWLGTLDPTSWPADAWFSGYSNLDLAAKEIRKAEALSLGWALSLSARRLLRVKALLERIRSDGGQVSLLVAFSAAAVESFSLASEVSRLFGELGVTIEFDLISD